jgi:hypothetical protein
MQIVVRGRDLVSIGHRGELIGRNRLVQLGKPEGSRRGREVEGIEGDWSRGRGIDQLALSIIK